VGTLSDKGASTEAITSSVGGSTVFDTGTEGASAPSVASISIMAIV